MSVQITNSLTKKKEAFSPIKEGHVNMYVCGPTVYGLTHIGNARPAVFFNVVRNFLEHQGFKVNYVSNFTDVDDKIINRAQEENVPAMELAEKYIEEFKKDMASLKVRTPNATPRVTQVIADIVKFIEGLIANGMAYAVENGEVFYSVRKFKGYGKLSGKNLDDLIAGARVDPDEKKKDPLDFSLWKPQKKDDEPAWDSPWGKGRPGWHIECSAMAMDAFGETFDIHGGGMDLMHPHHENEIAQSEGLSGKPFVRYWMHNNMLLMESEKMSKSIGNIFVTRDFINTYSAETLKYVLLSGHYRSTINFSEKGIKDAECSLHRLYSTKAKCEALAVETPAEGECSLDEIKTVETFAKSFREKWVAAMCDDFNTAKSLGYVFEYLRAINALVDHKKFKLTSKTKVTIQTYLDEMKALAAVFNLFERPSGPFLDSLRDRHLKSQGLTRESVELRLAERKAARKDKDFKKSDAIRDQLAKKGIVLKDEGDATIWDVSLTT